MKKKGYFLQIFLIRNNKKKDKEKIKNLIQNNYLKAEKTKLLKKLAKKIN